MRNEIVQARAKNEVAQAIYSVVLLVVIFIAINTLDSVLEPLIVSFDPYATTDSPFVHYVSGSVSYNDIGVALNTSSTPSTCMYHSGTFEFPVHVCVAMGYLERTEWLIKETMLYLTELREVVGVFQSTEISLTIRNTGLTSTPFDAIEFEENIIKRQYNILSKGLILFKMLEFALNMLSQVLFPALLMGGLVMRSFYFTRKLGGLLIAASIALYYAGPFALIIGHKAIFESNNFIAIDESVGGEVTPYMKRWSAESMYPNTGLEKPDITESNLITKMLKAKSFFIEAPRRLISIAYGYVHMHITEEGGYLLAEDGVVHMVSKITMLTIVVMFIALFAVLSTIKALAPLFGGDAEIAGLSYFL